MPVNSLISSRASTSLKPRRSAVVATSLALLLASACNQNAEPVKPKGPSAQEIEQRLLRISEAALAARPAPDATVQPWTRLAAVLPDAIGKLTASAPATGHTDTIGTQISKASRSYVVDKQTATIEVMDVARAPSVMLAFLLQQSAAKDPSAATEDGSKVTATNVGVLPALTRYAPTAREGHVTVAVANRFIVELRLSPTPNIEEAARIAGALPLEAIAALASPTVKTGEPPTATPAAVPAPAQAIPDLNQDAP